MFELINQEWSNPIFDLVLPFLRNKLFWIPLYLFLITFLAFNFGKKTIPFLLAIVICVMFTDFLSSEVIKKSVKRERPCRFYETAQNVQLRAHCGSGYSFTSSHAANHFGLAMIFSILFWKRRKKWSLIFLFWAGLISFSQVYVGVHFPLDIFAGALIGILIGFIVMYLYRVFISKIYE
ncbi:MAG: phosphatase PAP2 family protein [Bacteroidota bacterium]